MSTEGLVTGGDIARLLGISRQRLAQLRDSGEFPDPIARIGSAHVWRWADVEAWLDTRRGDRPEVLPRLERRARQLERLGYRVTVTRNEGRLHVGSGLAQPGSLRWSASISMRGSLSVGSEGEHDDPSTALDDALRRFDRVAGRQFTDRDIRARTEELLRRGWREGDSGALQDTAGDWWTYSLEPPDGGDPIRGKGETPLEARRQAVERAEDRQAEIDREE